jgi:hypothetical protein
MTHRISRNTATQFDFIEAFSFLDPQRSGLCCVFRNTEPPGFLGRVAVLRIFPGDLAALRPLKPACGKEPTPSPRSALK